VAAAAVAVAAAVAAAAAAAKAAAVAAAVVAAAAVACCQGGYCCCCHCLAPVAATHTVQRLRVQGSFAVSVQCSVIEHGENKLTAAIAYETTLGIGGRGVYFDTCDRSCVATVAAIRQALYAIFDLIHERAMCV
jgi:hypothetical protein